MAFRIASGFVEVSLEDRTRAARERVVREIESIRDRRVTIDANTSHVEERLARLREEVATATESRRIEIEASIGLALAELHALKDEADRLDGRRVVLDARVNDIDRTQQRLDTLKNTMDRMEESALRGFMALTKFGSIVSGVGSLLGPLSVGFANASIATGQFLAALLPLGALIPGLIASGGVLYATFKAIGPSIGESLAPITDELDKINVRVGDLAQKGVSNLAVSFVKLNMPYISAAMESIATSVNHVVIGFGKWLTSTEGIQATQFLVNSVSDAFENLAPHVERLLISFGKLIARIGDPAIMKIGELLGRAADATSRWADRLDTGDIYNSFYKIGDAVRFVTDRMKALKEAITWIGDHQDTIRKFSDAFAVIGIVAGVASGAWVGVVAGSVTLILNHFTTVKDALGEFGKFASDTFNAIANDPWVDKIVQDLKDIAGIIKNDFTVAVKQLGEVWKNIEPYVKQAWQTFGPFIDQVLKNPEVQRGIRIWVEGLAAIAASLIVIQGVVVVAVGIITAAVGGVIAWLTGAIGGGLKGAFDDISRTVGGAAKTISNDWSTAQKDVKAVWDAVIGFFESIPDRLNSIWQTISGSVSTAWDAVIGFFESIPDRIGSVWDSTKTSTVSAWDQIVKYVESIPDRIGNALDTAWEWVKTTTTDAWESIVTYVSSIPGRIGSFIETMVQDIWYKIGYLAGTIVGILLQIVGAILVTIGALPGIVDGWFTHMNAVALAKASAMVDAVIGFFTSLPGAIGGWLSSMWTTVSDWFTRTSDAATTKTSSMWDSVVKFTESLPGRIGQFMSSMWKTVSDWFTRTKDDAIQKVTSMWDSVVQFFQSLPERVSTFMSSLWKTVTDWFTRTKTSAETTTSNTITSVVGFFKSLPGRASSAVSSIVTSVTKWFTDTKASVEKTVTTMVDTVVTTVKSLPQKAVAALGNVGGYLKKAGSDLIQGFIDGIKSRIPDVQGILEGLTSKLRSWKGPPERDAHILERSGQLTMTGYIRGVKSEESTLRDYLGGLTSAVGGMTGSVNAASSRNGGPVYQLAAGAVTLDVSKIRDIRELLDMIHGVRTTARQYGAVPEVG